MKKLARAFVEIEVWAEYDSEEGVQNLDVREAVLNNNNFEILSIDHKKEEDRFECSGCRKEFKDCQSEEIEEEGYCYACAEEKREELEENKKESQQEFRSDSNAGR